MKYQKRHKHFCFLCRYEISKFNKSNKTVNYKGKHKDVCKKCTGKMHKCLEKKYNTHDIECKSCHKPVLFKKCISCSICDDFYHGKCLNFSRNDIDKIEEYNFYMCGHCRQSSLPVNYDQVLEIDSRHIISKKSKQKKQQCFTCCNRISSKKYQNKHILYNGSKETLCLDCSKLGLSIKLRDKNLLEFQDCPICKNLVKYESIFCDSCQHLVHPYCNGINRDEFDNLSKKSDTWYCLKCNSLAGTKNFTKHSQEFSVHKNLKDSLEKEYITYDDCSVCSKKVTGIETLACSSCKHWLHKKCIGNFSSRNEYQNFLKYYSTKEWDCPICRAEQLPFVLLSNKDFSLLLLELNEKPLYINKNNFQEIYTQLIKSGDFFTIPSIYEQEENNNYLDDIDPDLNFKMNDTCDYTIDTDKIKVTSISDLAMMTLNIRSIRKNFKNFTQLLSRIKAKIHIICLTETWLGPLDNIEDFELEGYNTPLFQNRTGDFCGGGVITYIHKDITTFKYVKGISFVDTFNHCLATELTINNKKSIILNVYRSPNNLNESFPDLFSNVIDKIKSTICYLLGDTNYNLINLDRHFSTEEYYNNLVSKSFKPLIWKPTRITEHSSTLIDHIWTNDLRHTSYMKSHIIVTDISDHLPCVTVVTNPEIQLTGYKTIKRRIFNDDNREKFIHRVNEIKDVLCFHAKNRLEENVDTKFNTYIDHLTRIYDECFPLKAKKVHLKSFNKPWITPNVQKLIDKKNKRFCKKKKNKTIANKDKYKAAKTEMENAIEDEKSKFYQKLLENSNNCNKKRWDAIRLIINRRKIDNKPCMVSDDVLGKYYENVAPNLANELPYLTHNDIPSTSKNPRKTPKLDKKFEFKAIFDREVYELILKLDKNKGPGIDHIDVKSLKSIAHIISNHLSILFNECISNGVYPQCLKIAKCIPIYKGSPSDPLLPSNYRPISILTAINKIFERILHNQLSRYLEENNLLPNFQYGYRKQHNTSQAILDLTSFISQQCTKQEITIAVFMDLSKAFDTVDASILKQKLSELGIFDMSAALINNYVCSRKFLMNENDHEKLYSLTYGVPQGSILGPLLFTMYTYDLTNITSTNKVIVYADDTTVLVSGKNLTQAKQHCNAILSRFYDYFTLNKLSINASKTKFMIYKPQFGCKKRKNLQDTTNSNIIMNGIILEQVKSIRFLGVIINDQLKWCDHKQHIYRKVCRSLGLLYKCKSIFNEEESINMYKAFIQPYFLYAIEVWGHTIRSPVDIMSKLQSKVLRILYGYKRSEDAWRYNDNRILPLEKLYESVIQKLCLKHHMNELPPYFTEYVMPNLNNSQLEKRITRISLEKMYDYEIQARNSGTEFKNMCQSLWNSLPLDLKMLPYTNKDNAYNLFNRTIKLKLSINP